MKLWAIADLHLANEVNRRGLEALPAHPGDDLIVAGDVGESEAHLEFALKVLGERFRRLWWVPGNHDLWTHRGGGPRGETKYRRWVEVCREHGVATPEDPFQRWPDADGEVVVAPLFVLYDYSFHPDGVADPIAWAVETGVLCHDEIVLHPDPYPSRPAWCAARVAYSEARLEEAAAQGGRLVLVNHFPLRREHAVLPRIPRFSIWCGTRATEDWHVRFPVDVVVYGHLHIKVTHWRDGVRFEEVSLGYPRDWDLGVGVEGYLRQILPPPTYSDNVRKYAVT